MATPPISKAKALQNRSAKRRKFRYKGGLPKFAFSPALRLRCRISVRYSFAIDTLA